MSQIEDSFFAVVEHSEEKTEPGGNESDVRRGDDYPRRFRQGA